MNQFLVKENQELICELLNGLFLKNFRLSLHDIDDFQEIYREYLFKIQDEYPDLNLIDKNKLLLKNIFNYVKFLVSNQNTQREKLLQRKYEKSKQDFEQYKPKTPNNIDFSDPEVAAEINAKKESKEKEEGEETGSQEELNTQENLKQSFNDILKQREEELKQVQFQPQDSELAKKWLNKDRDEEEEEKEHDKQREEYYENTRANYSEAP